MSVLTVSCHAYTHVDAPVHFLPGDRDITAMPIVIEYLTNLDYGVEIAAADSASARAALAFHMALAWSILARASA